MVIVALKMKKRAPPRMWAERVTLPLRKRQHCAPSPTVVIALSLGQCTNADLHPGSRATTSIERILVRKQSNTKDDHVKRNGDDRHDL